MNEHGPGTSHDEYERHRLLILIERLVRDGTPEHEIVRQVEQLTGGTPDPPARRRFRWRAP